MEQLNFMPRSVSKIIWENRIGALMQEMKENESAIIDVSQDASVSGQFYDHLEEFCQSMQQAEDKEEILLKRPWTDEDEKMTYFRLKDFDAHLKRNKFFEYKSHKIAQRLRDKGGESLQISIRGRPVRVWKIPSFDAVEVELSAPEFGGKENKEVF
jgi:hypothetical protein|tara:strand:+ start:10 stop:477 length:468 start_codon:yes stop_codon:yes gene_type:complete